jgi:hypothetical protein
MSNEFKKRIIDYEILKKELENCDVFSRRERLREIDPTGVLWTCHMNKNMTIEELKVMEILSRTDVYDIFAKYEVYA